jgi:hypothetical protein
VWVFNRVARRLRSRPRRWLGLDLHPSAIRLVVFEHGRAQAPYCAHVAELPIPPTAINGLVLEGVDEIAAILSLELQALDLLGSPVAMALPSPGVREFSWPVTHAEVGPASEADVYARVQQLGSLPPESWSLDYGYDEDAALNREAWAVVAREGVVFERYELAERVGLIPKVLDVERFAMDRFWLKSCEYVDVWPRIWLVWRDRLLSVHVALSPQQAWSHSVYALEAEAVMRELTMWLHTAGETDVKLADQNTAVTIRLTGLEGLRDRVISVVKEYWPQLSVEEGQEWGQSLGFEPRFAVAYGLALHPGLA